MPSTTTTSMHFNSKKNRSFKLSQTNGILWTHHCWQWYRSNTHSRHDRVVHDAGIIRTIVEMHVRAPWWTMGDYTQQIPKSVDCNYQRIGMQSLKSILQTIVLKYYGYHLINAPNYDHGQLVQSQGWQRITTPEPSSFPFLATEILGAERILP